MKRRSNFTVRSLWGRHWPRFVIHTSDVPMVEKSADKVCGHKDCRGTRARSCRLLVVQLLRGAEVLKAALRH